VDLVAGAVAVSVIDRSATEARCVLTFLKTTPVHSEQAKHVASSGGAADDDANVIPQVSVIFYAWLPGSNDDDDDINGHEVLVPPQASVVALVAAEFASPGPYVVMASARGAGLRQAASVTVAKLTSSYVQFTVAGASAQLCPEGCSAGCAPNSGVVVAVNPCQDVCVSLQTKLWHAV
jgi:hypothetical protein